MDLDGHKYITRAAIKELLGRVGERLRERVYRQMHTAKPGSKGRDVVGPDFYAVQRDMYDAFTFGHWRPFAQKRHFMRRGDEQTPYQAWDASCAWIHTNLSDFGRAFVRGDGRMRLQKLGNACHALQDSFSASHVTRAPFGPGQPGEITHIHIYADQTGGDHSHADEAWATEPWMFDLCKVACIDLMFLVVHAANESRQGRYDGLRGWPEFRERWLKASPKLQRSGAHDVDLIELHTNGRHLDESGLARSLYVELGTRTDHVTRVFDRLQKYDHTNADDVGRHYVKHLRRNPVSRVTRAVAQDPKLIAMLDTVFNSGARGFGDTRALSFLRDLRGALARIP